MDSLSAPGGSSDFQQELLALWQDPQVRSFVRKLAGDCDLIEDLWQAALCAVGTVKHPEHIDDRRAYFVTVLKHEAYRLYALSRATPVENPDQHGALVCGQAPARPVADTACTSVQAESWFDRLHTERACLEAAVAARSDDPAFYRAVIYTSAEGVLRDGINAEPSEADSNEALRAAYLEYFAQPGASANLLHQRFSRARADVRALLQAVVQRDELI